MEKAVKFHGHKCPGLALGVLVSKYILEHGNDFSVDEELVAVVENDNCSVDALQSLLGTTFGKGNLIYKDYGKNNYTIYNRTKEKAVNIRLNNEPYRHDEMTREERMKKLLDSEPEDIFNISMINYNPPESAQIHESIICDNCGDPTMATRIKEKGDQKLCIPCLQKL
ncbi:MAG: formylmethanofuran dehydrogenase [Candidatus Lokiarchaeota archaeon]|nr:formylmethanofuran dehydrogenase [Candidatus Lokiarchaeota archaeon]MBD3200111.1 formylmethanofuran dehydrogenase [Candidatus Lokiarchaeota archaeon]